MEKLNKMLNKSTSKWSETNRLARDMRRSEKNRIKLREKAKGHYAAMMAFITEYNAYLADANK